MSDAINETIMRKTRSGLLRKINVFVVKRGKDFTFDCADYASLSDKEIDDISTEIINTLNKFKGLHAIVVSEPDTKRYNEKAKKI